jgi:hypothetical protein
MLSYISYANYQTNSIGSEETGTHHFGHPDHLHPWCHRVRLEAEKPLGKSGPQYVFEHVGG